MKYLKFTIKNYKGIEEVNINLSYNRIVTLVGLNESGKTTIMEAIALFYKMIKGDEPNELELKTFRPKGAGFNGDIEIKGGMELEEDDISKIKKYWRDDLSKRTVLEIQKNFSYTYKFNFDLDNYTKTSRTCVFDVRVATAKKDLYKSNNNDWQKLITFIKNKLVPEILYYDDFIFEIPEKIQFVKKDAPENVELDCDKDLNKTWQLVMDDILKSTNPRFKSFKERIVDNWDDDQSLAKQHLSEMEGKLNEVITKRWKELFKDTGKKLNFEKIQLNCMPSGNFINVSFDVITTTHKSFRIDERSKGCKWFFSFLLFTEFRKNRTKNILFLLDEPASNLHSSAQIKIVDALGELSKESLVIYATHSHHLIKIDWLSGAYIIINEILGNDSLEGDMTFFDKANITAKKYYTFVGEGLGNDKISYFQPILDALDYQPSQVEPIPNICIVEGKNDWYTFKYFQEIILKDEGKYKFYPGTSATKLWDIIRLYLSWGKNFLIILDGDNAGEEAKKQYIEEFGNFISSKVFTLKDIIKTNGCLEKLIKDVDKNSICEEAFGKGNLTVKKKALNQAINQLLFLKRKVKISKETKNDFRGIFKFIKKYFN